MIIIDGAHGQLGNQLFTFANLIAFAAECKQTVVYPAFSSYSHSFEYFEKEVVCAYPRTRGQGSWWQFLPSRSRTIPMLCKLCRRAFPSSYIYLGEKRMLNLDDRRNQQTERLASSALSIVSGLYFVGHDTFLTHANLVRDVFRPTKVISMSVEAVENAARMGVDVLVGVHIRQGDYKHFGRGLSYFSSEEYGLVMRTIKELFPEKRIRFLVCSNEIQNGQFNDLDVTYGPGDAVGDLYSLARCDFLIGPPSTFTQWASFYGSVPRYVMAWKWQDAYNVPRTPIGVYNFRIHTTGFGSK